MIVFLLIYLAVTHIYTVMYLCAPTSYAGLVARWPFVIEVVVTNNVKGFKNCSPALLREARHPVGAARQDLGAHEEPSGAEANLFTILVCGVDHCHCYSATIVPASQCITHVYISSCLASSLILMFDDYL